MSLNRFVGYHVLSYRVLIVQTVLVVVHPCRPVHVLCRNRVLVITRSCSAHLPEKRVSFGLVFPTLSFMMMLFYSLDSS